MKDFLDRSNEEKIVFLEGSLATLGMLIENSKGLTLDTVPLSFIQARYRYYEQRLEELPK